MASQAPATIRERKTALVLAILVLAIGVIVIPDRAAQAAPPIPPTPGTNCSLEEWRADITGCINRLQAVTVNEAQCWKAPTPDSPDSGFAGWFASRPEASRHSGIAGRYSDYGYAGYSYTTYDIGCAATLMHPDYKFENTVANGEFMIATAVIGASNALRERAWNPGMMWSWADPLVEKATRNIYRRVFTVFGLVTLAVVGLYLLWRSRQAEMSSAMTTAGWALFVMVVVTALSAWPTLSAHMADKALTTSLGIVHDTVGPQIENIPPSACKLPDPDACIDHREPAVRASDTATQTILYQNWLRGLLGSADSLTAQRYGLALYQSRSLSWDEIEELRKTPTSRELVTRQKAEQWMKIAKQISVEDPEAYEYLRGKLGMERIGAGFIALLSAIMFASFDITASLLVLFGFLIFRWAVISAPILGTVGMLRPASTGFRRLLNAVVAAIFNIVIFGTGAAIYLFAVDLIMNTTTLPGWLQVVLVGLCGAIGWILLRPYRRVTQLGGSESLSGTTRAAWQRHISQTSLMPSSTIVGTTEPTAMQPMQRVELRSESPSAGPGLLQPSADSNETSTRTGRSDFVDGNGWIEPAEESTSAFVLYRPSRSGVGQRPETSYQQDSDQRRSPSRTEARLEH